MRHYTPGLTLAGIAALLLAACGSSGGSSSSSSGGGNAAPTANAGANQSVAAGATVTLNGSASSDSDGSIAIYSWTQTAGGGITLNNPGTVQPTFTAPAVTATTTLGFTLIVTDNLGTASAPSTVSVTVNPAANVPPTANAGANQTVTAGATVTLNGTASSDPDGSIASYAWTQTAGTAVTLSSATAAQPTFPAPTVATATTFTFSLIVTDNRGGASAASTVNVTVNPQVAGNTNVSGNVTFARVPFATPQQDANRGLYYPGPIQQPARGVIVRAVDPNNPTTVLATGSTDSSGNYTLSVPNNTSITLQLVARMVRSPAAGSPSWDVRVQNGLVAGTAPYMYTEPGSFNSSAGTAHNVAIPTGIDAAGVAAGARHSGPFAILDTIYQGIQTILGVAPTTAFPELIVDWGAQTGTFYSFGPSQYIALVADLARDTDEFDQHVIAHEFGHYVENNFARSDNIGGLHGLGDKLDPRVAFGEGFGYAFAAMVLNDPNARDSSKNNSDFFSTNFPIEDNPQTSTVGAPNDNYGCWCSESSVWSVLWDLYDIPADANDTLALGFAPLWQVLTGAQRTTPALTTIFSFISALKVARPGDATAINTLVAAQNIDATSIDAFGNGETHAPTNVPAAAALPLFTPISVGGSVTLRNVNDAGISNKLGNHRFLRFTPTSSGIVTISLTSSNPNSADPDFWLYEGGELVRIEDEGPPQPETGTPTVTAGTTYVLDVYDCTNGCDDAPLTGGGDFDLTVTIN
ncbi:MAG TPA: PKD domain-containing protein [Steroidobacteraceae bacterium]|nr:PKD domain-containing protein [Steroidobacteraceae bacterium]